MPYIVLMPIFAATILHGGPKALGTLMGATGIGAMFGALTLASRKGVRGLGRWVAVAAGSLGVFLIAFSFSRVQWLSTLLLLPVGYFMMLEMSSSNTLIQHHEIAHWQQKDRKSTRLNSSHTVISYAVFCLKKKNH